MKIENFVGDMQGGKTFNSLLEVKKHPNYMNFSLVYNYNSVLDDLMSKAHSLGIDSMPITTELMKKLRTFLIKSPVESDYPLFCAILNEHSTFPLESVLLWAKHRGIPTRVSIDEYDIYQIGFKVRHKTKPHQEGVIRDEWLDMAIKEHLIDVLQVNSATNVSGVISDIDWNTVTRIKAFEGYKGWDNLQVKCIDKSHIYDLLNGTLTVELARLLENSKEESGNTLVNIHTESLVHKTIHNALLTGFNKVTTVNYDTKNKTPNNDNIIVGGNMFSRSVSVPNLHCLLFYRDNLKVANTLQSVGRLFGKRTNVPVLVTTSEVEKSVMTARELEWSIQESGILQEKPLKRHMWLEEQIKTAENITFIPVKNNGFKESTGNTVQFVKTTNIKDYSISETYTVFTHPDLAIWDNWENPSHGQTIGSILNRYLIDNIAPYLKDVKGTKDPNDGAYRVWTAVKHYNGHYNRYLRSKNNYRKYPYLIGRVPNKRGVFYLIVNIAPYTMNTYHHDEDGTYLVPVKKVLTREVSKAA